MPVDLGQTSVKLPTILEDDEEKEALTKKYITIKTTQQTQQASRPSQDYQSHLAALSTTSLENFLGLGLPSQSGIRYEMQAGSPFPTYKPVEAPMEVDSSRFLSTWMEKQAQREAQKGWTWSGAEDYMPIPDIKRAELFEMGQWNVENLPKLGVGATLGRLPEAPAPGDFGTPTPPWQVKEPWNWSTNTFFMPPPNSGAWNEIVNANRPVDDIGDEDVIFIDGGGGGGGGGGWGFGGGGTGPSRWTWGPVLWRI